MAYNIFKALHLEHKELFHSGMIVAIAKYNKDCGLLLLDMLKGHSTNEYFSELVSSVNMEVSAHPPD